MGRALQLLPDRFAICRLPADADWPDWAQGSWVAVTRSSDELSVICPQEGVPAWVRCERDWYGLRLDGSFALTEVGVLAPLAAALSEASVPLLIVGTFETDCLFVPRSRLQDACAALRRVGCTIANVALAAPVPDDGRSQ